MKRPIIAALFALLAAAPPLHAGGYVLQSSFGAPFVAVSGFDSDAVGNLYVLGLPAGASTWQVAGYKPPELEPVFAFDTGLSSPAAFAVEGSGVIEVLDVRDGIRLRRFDNTGTFLSEGNYALSSGYEPPKTLLSAALDKRNGRVYLSYQTFYSPVCMACIGCSCGPKGTKGIINVYDLYGNLQKAISLPGISATPGTCYTPSALAAGPQGELHVADRGCGHILKYSPEGTLLTDDPVSEWGPGYFEPRAMWTDAQSSLYISMPICGYGGCPQGIVKLDGSNSAVQFAADSAAGCAWDDRVLYLSSAGAAPIQRYVYDGAPSVPAEASPIGFTLQHSSSAELSWQSSDDPDGDPVLYTVALGTSPTRLAVAGTTQETSFTTPALAFGVTYYWQVTAQDSHLDMPILRQSAPVVGFRLALQNAAPGAFAVSGGTGTVLTRDDSALFSWQKSADPDNDPLSYEFNWHSGPQNAVIITTAPAARLTGLSFGSTYYWNVAVRDVYGSTRAMSGGEQSYCPIFKNSAPDPVRYLTTTASFALHTTSPTIPLSWASSADPDEDEVNYRAEIRTASFTWSAVELGTSTNLRLSPQVDTTYYWRVNAADPYGGVSTGPWQPLFVQLANRAPAPIAYLSPSTISTRTDVYALSWQDGGDPDGDPYAYGVYLSTDPVAPALVQSSTQTQYTLGLQYGATYYWRVVATDSFGATASGEVRSFVAFFLNDQPGELKLKAPLDSARISTMKNSVEVTWAQVNTPQGDPITYTVYLGDAPGKLTPLARIEQLGGSAATAGARVKVSALTPVPQASTTVEGDSFKLTLTGLDYYRTYYMRVTAANPYGAASATPLQSFTLAAASEFPRAYNYPNPFSPGRGGTNIVFNAPPSGYGRALVSVYSELQDLLFEREYRNIPPGVSQVGFDGRDRYGRPFFNGSYICRVRFEEPSDAETFYLLVVK